MCIHFLNHRFFTAVNHTEMLFGFFFFFFNLRCEQRFRFFSGGYLWTFWTRSAIMLLKKMFWSWHINNIVFFLEALNMTLQIPATWINKSFKGSFFNFIKSSTDTEVERVMTWVFIIEQTIQLVFTLLSFKVQNLSEMKSNPGRPLIHLHSVRSLCDSAKEFIWRGRRPQNNSVPFMDSSTLHEFLPHC